MKSKFQYSSPIQMPNYQEVFRKDQEPLVQDQPHLAHGPLQVQLDLALALDQQRVPSGLEPLHIALEMED